MATPPESPSARGRTSACARRALTFVTSENDRTTTREAAGSTDHPAAPKIVNWRRFRARPTTPGRRFGRARRPGIGRRILERAVLAEGYDQTNVLTGKGPQTVTRSFISQKGRSALFASTTGNSASSTSPTDGSARPASSTGRSCPTFGSIGLSECCSRKLTTAPSCTCQNFTSTSSGASSSCSRRSANMPRPSSNIRCQPPFWRENSNAMNSIA